MLTNKLSACDFTYTIYNYIDVMLIKVYVFVMISRCSIVSDSKHIYF